MSEKKLVGGAEIIQALAIIRRPDKSMLGAFAVADEAHAAFQAASGQAIQLVSAELDLLLRLHRGFK